MQQSSSMVSERHKVASGAKSSQNAISRNSIRRIKSGGDTRRHHKNLLAKQSLTKRSREIHSTEEDQAIIATVTPQISDPAITALWEQALEENAQGRQTRDVFLQRQEAWIKQFVEQMRREARY